MLHLDPVASQEENLFWELYPSNMEECYQHAVPSSACGLLPTDPFRVPGTLSPPRGSLLSLLQPLDLGSNACGKESDTGCKVKTRLVLESGLCVDIAP